MEKLSDWLLQKFANNPHLSRADLARAASTSRANVALWTKKGSNVNLKTENLYAVARFFGVEVSEVPSAVWRGIPKAPTNKPRLNDPYPNADRAMLVELYELAAALPVTRKALLLEIARAELIAWKKEQSTTKENTK